MLFIIIHDVINTIEISFWTQLSIIIRSVLALKREEYCNIRAYEQKIYVVCSVTFGPSYYKNVDMVKEIKFIGIKLQVEQ